MWLLVTVRVLYKSNIEGFYPMEEIREFAKKYHMSSWTQGKFSIIQNGKLKEE